MLRTVAALALLAPVPAAAGWGGAEWGMSRAEVSDLRDELPVESTAEFDRYKGAVTSIDVGVVYKFSVDGLALIAVDPTDAAACHDFMNAVRGTYGAPFSVSDSEFVLAEKWRDEKNGNLVNLFAMKVNDVPTSCSVMYEPISTPNSGDF